MIKIIIFTFTTLLLALLSRSSLRVYGSHGFYRFFAWECMLLLFLLNVGVWFRNPFSWAQMISWILLFISLILLVIGAEGLIRRGKPGKVREDETHLFGFEKTSQLVTSGIYRYIRHPLYSSLFWLTWGIFFKQPGWAGFILSLGATLLLNATARADEVECIRYFGSDYTEYMKKSKRFLPFIF